MTLLSVVQDAMVLCGLNAPSTVYSNEDARVVQMKRLLYVEGRYLLDDHDWRELCTANTFTSGSAAAQTLANGASAAQPPSDFHRMSRGVDMWNETNQWPIAGPVNAEEWNELLVRSVVSLPQYWRLIGSDLNIFLSSSGDTIRYEYITNKWIKQGGTTPATTLSADTDTFYFPENLMSLGIAWRWKKAKQLDYAEDMRDWQLALATAKGNNIGGRRIISTSRNTDENKSKHTWMGSVTPV